MTISVSQAYEKGKAYEMLVLFDSGFKAKADRYLNVLDSKSGTAFKVEVPVAPDESWGSLNGKTLQFVCTEVTDRGPEFALAEKYFPKPAKPKVGAKLGISESEKVEFKTSLIYSPVSHQPDSDQPFEIAKQVAAMMNTDGGTLYLGVNDAGYVTGIENDFPVLGQAAIKMKEKTDAEWTYHQNADGYKQKFRNAIYFYLGPEAASRLNGNVKELVDEESNLSYLMVLVPPSEDAVYLGYEESIVFRMGASVHFLRGRARDQYVKNRFYGKGEKTVKDALELFQKENEALKKQLASLEEQQNKLLEKGDDKAVDKALDKVISVYGKKYLYEKDAGFALEKDILAGIEKPAGILYKAGEPGQRMYPCSKRNTWHRVYEALLRLCSDLDPVKFESLPENELFCKAKRKDMPPYFARKGNGIHLDDASEYLGSNQDVRADLRCGIRDNFLDASSLPRRLMTYFGIEAKDVRIWNGK